jgi:4-hydroxybenzoate polyprenyltransferase
MSWATSVDTAAAPSKGFDLVAYLKLFRFPLVFTAIADSTAGYLVASNHLKIEIQALLAVSSAGLYFFGMALNDIADRERDKHLAPGRVLPSGRLTLRAAEWAAVLTVLVSLTANLMLGYDLLVQRLAIWGMAVVAILAYDLFLKLPPVMGLVRACNLLLGVSAIVPMGGEFPPAPWVFALVALPTFLYVSALTYVSTLEDVGGDRAKVFLGGALMALGALLAAIALPLWSAVDGRSAATGAPDLHGIVNHAWRNWHGIVFATLLAGWILRRARAATDRKGIMLMVRDGVGGIIFLDAALVGSLAGLIPALCVAALLIPAVISVAIFKKLA